MGYRGCICQQQHLLSKGCSSAVLLARSVFLQSFTGSLLLFGQMLAMGNAATAGFYHRKSTNGTLRWKACSQIALRRLLKRET